MSKTAFRLVLLAVAFSAIQCGNECDEYEKKHKNCFCERDSPNFNSWSIECFSSFKIDYRHKNYVLVECRDNSSLPLKESMFKELNISGIDHFKFKLCPLPNVTLASVLDGMDVKKIKIELPYSQPFPSDFFAGLEDLEMLTLSTSYISELPVDLFHNLTKLLRLDLNENLLTTLPEGIFEYQGELKQLQLSGNNFQTLPVDVFANLTKLNNLYLYKNKFKEIPPGLFNNTSSLRVVDFTNNEIKELNAELFESLPALNYIYLKGNSLETLPSALFKNNRGLGEIYLSGNVKLKHIGEDLFRDLSNLTKIDMMDCHLESIPDKLFWGCQKLEKLNLKNNKLSYLHEDIFKDAKDLKEINLNYNNLNEIPIKLFRNQSKLKKLYISSNNIRSLEVGVFENLMELTLLQMIENRLESLDTRVMEPLQALEDINFSRNQIANLTGPRPFGKEKIKLVNLDFNNLTALEGINWEFYLNMQNFTLQNNNLKTFHVPNLLMDRLTINLRHNNLTYIDVSGIQLIEKLNIINQNEISERVEIYLGGNELECDCRLFGFVKYASDYQRKQSVKFPDSDKLKCKSEEGHGQSLLSMDRKLFTCENKENCPSTCKCDYRASDHVSSIHCLNLTDLPDELPDNTTEVYLLENKISDLSGLDNPRWENVTVLVLNNNNLTSAEWKWPPKLQILSLAGNQIEWLGEATYEYIQNKDNNFRLYLKDNPWFCDCTTLGFKDFLQENSKKVQDLEDVFCHNEVYLNGTSLHPPIIKLSNELCPEENEIKNAYLITVSVVCVILAVLLFLVSVLYYRNKQMLTAYVYIHFYRVFVCFFSEEELDEDKTYDAFISYSSADRDVALALMKELEEGEPKFKLCIHERDWLPGNLITWNIANSVQNSRKTILVLSKSFLESLWFQIEFHTAYYQMLEDRIDRLIVIVKGDLPKKDTLDKDLQFLLSTKTYLEWGERWFWEKLRFALPHHQRAIMGSDKRALQQKPNGNLLKTVEDKLASLTINGGDNGQKTESKLSSGIGKNGSAYINHSLMIEDENKPKSGNKNNSDKGDKQPDESLENAINLQEMNQVPLPPVRPKRSPVPV